MSVTIYDVANKAGVSISTVSRVLNKNPNVLEETRQRVLKVIAELGFKPSSIARGLVGHHTNLIQVLFSWQNRQFDFRNNWYVSLLNGFNATIQKNGYGLMVNTIAGIFEPEEIYATVFRNASDGILVVSPFLEEKDILGMNRNAVPMVLVGHRIESDEIDYVDSDNQTAAEQIVDHLAGLGHKRIAIITGPMKGSSDTADRLNGYKNAMKKHGFLVPSEYIVEGNFNKVTGALATEKLLALPERPTAIFCCDDLMAMGAWDTVEKKGLEVGKDVSLVGFDDIEEASHVPYSLTTVRQDYHNLSTQATLLLLEKIKSPDKWKPKHLLLPTQLIARDSTGPV
jgi:LacI family transcriptional regulator